VRIEDVSTHLPAPAPALASIFNETLPEQVRYALRLWPHRFDTAGFFAARLSKLDSIPEATARHWRILPAGITFGVLSSKEIHRIILFLQDHYGFDLEKVLDKSFLEVVTGKNQYYLVPGALRDNYKNLPVLYSGLPLGKPLSDQLLISHEFISRFGDQFTNGMLLLEDEFILAWVHREDIRGYKAKNFPLGKIYAVRDRHGRNLGRGKLLEGRLKNMLPTRLF
jgi:16S rRNA (cytosine1407-C5)-methyltransferase